MADFIRTVQPVTTSDLTEVEREFDFSFPADIRSHYLNRNGGRPKNNLFKKDDRFSSSTNFFPSNMENQIACLKMSFET